MKIPLSQHKICSMFIFSRKQYGHIVSTNTFYLPAPANQKCFLLSTKNHQLLTLMRDFVNWWESFQTIFDRFVDGVLFMNSQTIDGVKTKQVHIANGPVSGRCSTLFILGFIQQSNFLPLVHLTDWFLKSALKNLSF